MCHWKDNEDILYTTTKIHILVFYIDVYYIYLYLKKMHIRMQLNCIQLYVEQWLLLLLLLFVIQNKYIGTSASILLVNPFC